MKSSKAIGTGASARSLFEGLENRLLFAFGQTDPNFGVAGRAFEPFSDANRTPIVQQMLITSGGNILAGGSTGLARFTPAGAVDSTFGSSGKVAISSAAKFIAEAVDPTNGNIYVVITASSGVGLTRYGANGKLDSAFGTGGTATVSTKGFAPQAMAVQADGKIVIAGNVKTDTNSTGRKVRVYRLKTDGTPDSTFGTAGIKEFNFGASSFLAPVIYDKVVKVAIVAGNKIDIIGGSITYSPSFTDPDTGDFTPASYDKAVFAVARLTTAGTLDSTYGSSGISRSTYASAKQIQNNGIDNTLPTAAALRSDDSVLIAGLAGDAVVGEISFSGTTKYIAAAEGASLLHRPSGLTALGDGRSVLIASPRNSDNFDFAAISSTGKFGNVIYTDDGDSSTVDLAPGVGIATAATASDGKLLIGGSAYPTNSFEVEKFEVGSASDPRPDEFANGTVNDVVKDANGNLYLAYYDASTTHLIYAHRHPSGVWDTPVVLDKNPKAGQYISIDVTHKGNPGIAYYDGTNGDLKLAQFTGKSWKFEIVESKGNVGVSPSLDYDDADEPVLTYYKPTTHRLNFAIKKKNLTWSYEVVDSSGDDVGRSNALVVSPSSNRYTVAYTDDTTGSVMWAKHQSAGVWQIKTAAKTTAGADFVSMAYGYSYAPMIAFFDKANADLKISSFNINDKVFKVTTLATAGIQGPYNASFFTYYYGYGQIYSYNKSSNSVTLFQDVNYSSIATTVVTGGGKYLSVDYNGSTTDLVYLDAATGKLKVRPTPNP
jgi:uncharacterized delta-60 repeat protein